MHKHALIIAALLVSTLGCTVLVDAPFGTPLTQQEKETFTGRWTASDSEVIEFRLARNGSLCTGQLSWSEEQQKYVADTIQIDLRRAGNNIYGFVQNLPNDEDRDQFGFMLIEKINNSEMNAYFPDVARFRAAIESGKLNGEVTSETINIERHPDPDEGMLARFVSNVLLPSKLEIDQVVIRTGNEATERFFGSREAKQMFVTESTNFKRAE